MTKKEFIKKWIKANTLGFFAGYLLYTPIGHGITGNHGRDLTTNQIIAHSIGLAVVALLLFTFQKSALKQYFQVSIVKIMVSTALFIGLFWFGYYQTVVPGSLDYDILFSFLVLGSALWINSVSLAQHKWRWVVALIAFPLASFLGEVLLFVVFTSFKLNMDMQNTTNDMIFWLTVGLTTGMLGGWISGHMLYHMLPNKKE